MALIGSISSPTVTGNLTIGSDSLSYSSDLQQTLVNNQQILNGGTYFTYSAGESSSANNNASGFKNLKSFSFPTPGANRKVISVGFTSYISSGSYYYTWRLYNAREGAPLPFLPGLQDSFFTGDSESTVSNIAAGGGIRFEGGVHNYSAQSIKAFDASFCLSGDTIYLQMCGHTSGGGDVAGLRSDNAQVLYVKHFMVYRGVVHGHLPASMTYYW